MAGRRVGALVRGPDEKGVVYDWKNAYLAGTRKFSVLWFVPASGGESRRLNPTPNHEERPRFSPDGKRLIWTSKATDPTQIWMCDFDPNAGALVGKPHQVTNISTGADGAIWSPDGKNIVFVSAAYPDCKDDACNKQRDEELKKSKVKAKIFTRLFYRHWNAFTEFKRSHLFVVGADADLSQMNTARDLTPGDHDVPPFSLVGQDMYTISPDGQEVAYTSNIDEVEATSTNNEIFTVPVAVESAVPSGKSPGALRTAHATASPKKISTGPGSDTTPLYSPDGKYLAWRSQARAGFEADKWRLLVQDRQTGKTHDVTNRFDRSVGSFTWHRPMKFDSGAGVQHLTGILFTAEDHGESPIYNCDAESTDAVPTTDGARLHCDDLVCNGTDNLYFTRQSIGAPNEIWLQVLTEPEPKQITHMNDALLSTIDMQPLESFTFKGANNDEVQGFLVTPPGFDPNSKYPLKFLIHGEPQGTWGNSWTYRWNAELFAATGNYVVVMINFHGSTGYGQKFTDSISGDW